MDTNYYAKLAKNKSLLKEYKTSFCDRTVYLDDGDEFQFQIFNPEKEEIAVRITIESTQLSHDIVVRPGERVWIERYTDTPKKFRFNTYYVNGDNKEVQEAIADNGDIMIQFYHKKKNNNYTWINQPNITWTYYNDTSAKPYDYSFNDFTITCDSDLSMAVNSINTSAINANCSSSVNSVLYSEPLFSCAATNVEETTKEIETGRVMKGGNSNQKFESIDMDFEYFSFKTEKIKILPTSRKPYNSNDLRKIYCTNCGRKLNTKYKYCPYCGQKIQ